MSITAAYARSLLALARKGLDEAAVVNTRRLVRDGIAVAVAGAFEPGPTILRRIAADNGNAPASSMIGGGRAAPAEAARANGAAMHVLDWEPMWNPANHSLSTTLPAILALSEAAARRAGPFSTLQPFEITGERLLTALAIGVEAQARMRRASGQLDPGRLKFHPPGAVGAFGAATASGILLGLDEKQMTHALAIAASRTAGIQANVGSMTKALHCGEAAAAGLESALMAAHGFTGDADAIGDPRGYGRALYGETFDPLHLTNDALPLNVATPGPAWKLFPSQYGTHFAITAALAARNQIIALGASPDAISAVRLHTPEMPYIDRPQPLTGLAGKFSFQYTTAAALLDGRVTVASFADSRRFAPEMRAMLDCITLAPDATREGRFDRLRLDIDVTLSDGRTVQAHCDGPAGIWGRPVETARIEAKWHDALADSVGAERGEAIDNAATAVATGTATELLTLMELCTAITPAG